MNTALLGEICSFASGGTPSRKRPEFFEGTIPWITGADVTDQYVTSARSHITKQAVANSATTLVEMGTVLLVTRTGVGKAAIAGTDLAFSQDITALFPDETMVDKKFLLRALLNEAPKFQSRAQGATIQGITREMVEETSIFLPPLEEQKRIAGILDAADQLRTKRQQASDKVEILQGAIFRHMFGDPLTANGPGTDSKNLRLGDLARIRTGKLDANAASPHGRFPFFTCAVESLRINDAAFDTKAILVAGNGDLNVKYYEGKFNAYQRTYVIESLDEHVALPIFLYGFLDLYVGRLREQAIGGVIKYIKLGHLTEALVSLPSADAQADYEKQMQALDTTKQKYQVLLDQAANLFASLQQRAFRGDL